ncbi:hypothetical protein [Paracoccus denitrificans]|uniref:Uncharacterized protein n=1 Tax=Paracoccus denitrificans (strain Pd 1222) TaxID=318586 RepID=A1B8G6_PARDP|nr:hypothetical protein [Paracoccus denitrificans]ABL71810.1 hypothetical protein Pden_3743 [Paracoccus denitrificans PD1222]MBB4628091.1 hypothetical protein [Paracoccus denitrificans]MCU7429157.1 hypothetical protein [Paracoccus denitrificans]QAR28395.1 hypothetical protein EO213_19010 [Paracoccus denitrificans]UPV96531.1 hypothetical protein M0K93_19100 [Paracoccus denitrificans]
MATLSVPASCPNCGLIFPSGVSVTNAFVELNIKVPCQRCGTFTPAIDGAFSVIGDAIKVFSSSDFTIETLEKLNIAVEDLRRRRITPDEARASLAKHSPALAEQFGRWAKFGLNFIGCMAAVGSFVLAYLQYDRPNRDVLDVAMERFEETYYEPQVDTRRPLLDVKRPPVKPGLTHQKNRKERRAEKAKERRNRR